MQNLKKNIFNLLGFLFFNLIFSQEIKKIDSLEIEILKKQNVSSLVNNYNQLTREYLKVDIQKSIEYNNKVWKLLKKDVEDKNKSDFYRNKATIEIMTEKPELCIEDSKIAAKIYLKIKDTIGYLNTMYDQAYATAYLNKFKESIELAKNSLKLSKSDKFSTQIAKLNHVLCINYINLYETKNALYHIKKSIYFYRKSKMDNNLVILNCYNEISNIYLKTKQFDKALEYAKFGVKLRGLDDLNNNQVSVAYTLISNIYTELKDYKNALFYIKIAIRKSQRPNNKYLIAQNINLLAVIYLKQKKYDLSIENVKKAIAVSKINMFETDENQILGNCYYAKSQLQKAPDLNKSVSNQFDNESLNYLKKAQELQKKVIDTIENSKDKERENSI